jgi:hypothetical protein
MNKVNVGISTSILCIYFILYAPEKVFPSIGMWSILDALFYYGFSPFGVNVRRVEQFWKEILLVEILQKSLIKMNFINLVWLLIYICFSDWPNLLL